MARQESRARRVRDKQRARCKAVTSPEGGAVISARWSRRRRVPCRSLAATTPRLCRTAGGIPRESRPAAPLLLLLLLSLRLADERRVAPQSSHLATAAKVPRVDTSDGGWRREVVWRNLHA
jgi:hypothetical protein